MPDVLVVYPCLVSLDFSDVEKKIFCDLRAVSGNIAQISLWRSEPFRELKNWGIIVFSSLCEKGD